MSAVNKGKLKAIAMLCLTVLLSAGCSNDCGWGSSAKAWIDENRNGIWDTGEAPLSGVQFWVDKPQKQPMNARFGGKTDSQGEARLFAGLIGCGPIDYVIYPEVPTGYQLTTQSPLRASGMPGGTYGPYLFGFLKSSDASAVSPVATPVK